MRFDFGFPVNIAVQIHVGRLPDRVIQGDHSKHIYSSEQTGLS